MNKEKLTQLKKELKTDIPLPLYYQLKQQLKKHITNGLWKVEERIPAERELCDIFRVSRTTVRQAINELVNEGLLYRSQGRGTFVAKPKLSEGFIQRAMGFYQEMTSRGLRVETEVLEQAVIIAPDDVSAQLQIDAGAKVIKIERLRAVEGERGLVVDTYIPFDICPNLVEEDLSHGSLYEVLREKYGLKIETGSRTIEAVLASDYDAQLLGIPKGASLLLLKSIGYLADGSPLEYYEAKHRGDKCKFEVEVIHSLIK